MSLQAAKDFIEKAKNTEAIQKALHDRTRSAVDIGREHGFEFTREEFGQALREGNVESADGEGWCSYA